MTAPNRTAIRLCLLSLCFAVTAMCYAQNSTLLTGNKDTSKPKPVLATPDDTISQKQQEYADDNLRLAAAVKLQREIKLMRTVLLDLEERKQNLDSVIKAREKEIEAKEFHLAQNANYISVLVGNNKRLQDENKQLRLSNNGEMDKWKKKAQKPFVVTLGPSIGYDLFNGSRIYGFTLTAGPQLIRF